MEQNLLLSILIPKLKAGFGAIKPFQYRALALMCQLSLEKHAGKCYMIV